VVVVGVTGKVPVSASLPLQPPEAVHEVAFVLDQASVEAPPAVMLVGVAVSVTLGAAAVTVTRVEAGVLPPGPEQVKVYVVVVVGDSSAVPLVACVPVQPPDAVQLVALVLDQVSVELAPAVMLVGEALSATVGAGGVTVTVAEAGVLPPAPVHVSV
jgi:hypothetical protein